MEEQLINAEILNLLNEKKEISHVLEQIALKLKDYLGCGALGIRIKDSQGNIPYAVAVGFNDKFLARENFLSVRAHSCECIEIIEGKYDPDLPFYTPYGSFFTDNLQSLTPVLDGMRTGKFRGECVRCGWECLGVVPVRFAHRYFGAIHFVAREASAIQRRQVQFIENVASEIGLYIHSIAAGKEKEGELLAVVQRIIHDLRSPLTSIKGFSELITLKYSDRLKDDVPVMVERIYSNAEYIEHLIASFGDFANSTGRVEEHPETIDLKEFVLNLVSEMDLPTKEDVEIKFEENIPLIEYPPFSLKRILSNLISNAVKYTPGDRRPVIEIGCQEKDIFYQFSVKDSGPGINTDDLEKIFYPLYRSREAANIPGSGLGLSICKKLVEKCGGTIWAYSDKGKGSTFYFTVPKV
ncbi:MAG: HAMP domain-containing sensor histidine kinase [Nitrospirota bacterium]